MSKSSSSSSSSWSTVYVNLYGGPGCGKSTLMALMFYHFKTMGISCEMVTEYAKELVWEERMEELDNQHQVAREQYKMLKARKGKTQVVVTDGPLANSLYYNQYYPHVCSIEKTHQAVLGWMNDFKSVELFVERGNFEYEQAGRYQSEQRARKMDAEIYNTLSKSIRLHKVSHGMDIKSVCEHIVSNMDKPKCNEHIDFKSI